MNLQTMRWPVVVATMAIVLASLFGGGLMLKSRTVEEPLKALYSTSALVDSYSVAKPNESYLIRLKLNETPDLAAAYTQLDLETAKILGATPYRIEVEDRRSPALEQVYQRVNLYVQEAIATGRFAAMATSVEEEAAKAGMTAKLAVDNDRVYVQLQDQGSYLYGVVDRRPGSQATDGSTAKGGVGL